MQFGFFLFVNETSDSALSMHNQLQITSHPKEGKIGTKNSSKHINVKAKGFWAFHSNQEFFLRKKKNYWMMLFILYNSHFQLAFFYNP